MSMEQIGAYFIYRLAGNSDLLPPLNKKQSKSDEQYSITLAYANELFILFEVERLFA